MADPSHRRSLDSLKNEARRWLKELRAGNLPARERLERILPQVSNTPSLRDVQHALAREHGYAGWKALTDAIEARGADGERSLSRYEAAAAALLDAYRSGTPESMERHYSYTWHRRAWPAMRTYVQLDLGKRPPQPGGDVEITIDDARYLVAAEHGFESWQALVRFTATAPSTALETAKPVGVLRRNASGKQEEAGRARDWDTIARLLAGSPGAELHANGQMTDAALARIASVGTVKSLQLAGSHAVTDDGLRHLARLPGLERLDVSRTSITDRGLEVLRHLLALKSLSLAGTSVTDAGAAHLAHCASLESINLSWTDTGDGAVRALAGKNHLREFHSGVTLTDAGLAAFQELPRFRTWHGGEARVAFLSERVLPTHLTLRGPFTDGGVVALRTLEGLFSLDLDAQLGITAAALDPLVDLPHLSVLSVDANDDWMPAIAAMPHLRSLGVQDTVAGDDGFSALGRSRSLEYIWGRRCHNLRRRGFVALANIPTLVGLSVSCLNVDDEGIAALPSFPALRELMPMDIPDDGYRHIGRCGKLESLILMYCRDTTDRATEQVADLRLHYYFNSYTTITDRTPEILSRMDTLERITFDGCHNLTDEGVARLARLPQLRELRIAGRGLTPAVVGMFPPRIEVHFGD